MFIYLLNNSNDGDIERMITRDHDGICVRKNKYHIYDSRRKGASKSGHEMVETNLENLLKIDLLTNAPNASL